MSLMEIPVALAEDPMVQPLTVGLHALEERVQRVAAERDDAVARERQAAGENVLLRRQVEAYRRRIAELEHSDRELRKANEAWRVRFEDVTRTVELPKYPTEPEPRRRRRGRHQ